MIPQALSADLALFIDRMALGIAVMGVLLWVSRRVRVRVRVRRPRLLLPFDRALAWLGLSLAMATPAAASGRRGFPMSPERASAPAPWSESAEFLPPPLSAGRIEAPPWTARNEIETARPETRRAPVVHPAIHGRRVATAGSVVPLFPRAGSKGADASDEQAERAACIARHPAGKGLAITGRKHTVSDGDTLWGLAGRVLETEDPSRIARYWPLIHRVNRAVIGRDPNLLLPGQILELPCEPPAPIRSSR